MVFSTSLAELTYQDIHDLVHVRAVREGYELDYKGAIGNPDKAKKELAKDICAFANSRGGYLVIGVDKDNAIIGIPRLIQNRNVDEWINQVLSSNVEPSIFYHDPKLIDVPNSDNVVVVIHVPESLDKPHMVTEINTYYIRINDSSKTASHSRVREMFMSGGRTSSASEELDVSLRMDDSREQVEVSGSKQEAVRTEIGSPPVSSTDHDDPSISDEPDFEKEFTTFKAQATTADGPKQERSEVVLASLFRNSLRAMFEQFLTEMDRFVDLFKLTSHHVQIGRTSTHYGRDSCIRAMENAFNELEYRARKASEPTLMLAGRTNQFKNLTLEQLTELQITVSFDDYLRGGINIFSAFGNIKVAFRQYTYVVEIPGRPQTRTELLYHQQLSSEASSQLVHLARLQTWQGIQAHLQK